MLYDGRQVTNYILDFSDKRNISISNLALQKILYFCHAWSLVKLDRPLIRHHFEAWQFGPVLQYIYREFKHYERSPITSRSMSLDPNSGQKKVVAYNFDSETNILLNDVINFYSRLSPGHLVDLSHSKDGPWAVVWNHEGKVKPGMKIEDADIKSYYSKARDLFSIQ